MKLRLGDRHRAVDPRWRWGSTALLFDSNCDHITHHAQKRRPQTILEMLKFVKKMLDADDNSQCNKHVSSADSFENTC